MSKNVPQDVLQITPSQRFRLYAYSTPVRFEISLKKLQASLGTDHAKRFTQHCLIYTLNDTKKVFIFSFGTLVFFNVPETEHEGLMARFGIEAPPRTRDPETDEFAEDNLILDVREASAPKVGFNTVTMPDLDLNKLQLISQVLAQSSALELIEWEVDEFLAESERMTGFLKNKGAGSAANKRERLLQFLGEGLSAKHKIVNQLAIFSEPDRTWEREEFYNLYLGMFDNFDIKERIETIEKKLALCSEVTELLLEIANARRNEMLELTIIALIMFEILLTSIFPMIMAAGPH